MAEQAIRVGDDALRRFAHQAFVAAGLVPAHADSIADILVWANLRGVDSHGVQRIPRYLEFIELGFANPRPDMQVVRETPATLLLEADRAFGPVALTHAMGLAIDKARAAGIGWCVIRNTTHGGAIGYYTLQAAAADMAGLAVTTSLPNMAYHGSRTAGVATSPIAIAVPGAQHAPLLIDMGTSVASIGKLAHARNAGLTLPEGWALDKAGDPTTDAGAAVLPMPLGGPKGAGLSLLFECLTGLMADNPLIEVNLTTGHPPGAHCTNALVAAVDIAAFIAPDRYKERVDGLVAALKTLPRAAGTDEILAPGERGDGVRRERARDGIPVPPGTWRNLSRVAERHGIDLPDTL